jgi:hypothetical protein
MIWDLSIKIGLWCGPERVKRHGTPRRTEAKLARLSHEIANFVLKHLDQQCLGVFIMKKTHDFFY